MDRILLKDVAQLCEETVGNWMNDRAPSMGAALAYYVALSLAPTVVIIVAITGLALDARAAQGRLISQIHGLMGNEGAKVIQSMIAQAHRSSDSAMTILLGLATLFFAGTAVVTELTEALNTIWHVPADDACTRTRSVFNLIKRRLTAFGLVLGAGLVLFTSLIVRTWISATVKYLKLVAPPHALIQTVDWVISFGLITALFAFLFKVLPAVRLKWNDVSAGAALTTLLFTAGKLLLGVYLGRAGFSDSYGAAGSLVVFLVWVYYSAQVVYLGAEFTRTYTLRLGSMLTPKPEFPASLT